MNSPEPINIERLKCQKHDYYLNVKNMITS